jgi:hypothetical protein
MLPAHRPPASLRNSSRSSEMEIGLSNVRRLRKFRKWIYNKGTGTGLTLARKKALTG